MLTTTVAHIPALGLMLSEREVTEPDLYLWLDRYMLAIGIMESFGHHHPQYVPPVQRWVNQGAPINA